MIAPRRPPDFLTLLAKYNAHMRAARSAYAADQAVRDGFCPECHTRRIEKHRRLCTGCRKKGTP